MSSRIISSADAAGVAPIRWRRAQGESAQSMVPQAAQAESPEAGDDGAAELQAALAAIAGEAALKESQARQAGRAEGEAATRQRLEAPLVQAAQRLSERVEEIAGLRRKLRREAEEDLVRLAVAIARRVIHRELSADPGAILGVVKAALDKVDARELLRIRVNPQDVGVVSEAIRERNIPDQVDVSADTSLERGGLILETPRGSLDASVESQLTEIERGFTDLVRRGPQ
jgi:flagellar assembly protein FliH